jgi:hypothetical protein
MNTKSPLVLSFSIFITSHAFAIAPVYEGESGILKQVFVPNCLDCHASDKIDADRHGAPPEVNFDTYEATLPNAERAIVRAVEEMTMPPASSGIPLLNEEQTAAMLAWQDRNYQQLSLNNHATFDGTKMIVPVVNVDSQKFTAVLRRIPLESSSTGYGYMLESAETTMASADYPATFDPETGEANIPWIKVIDKNGTEAGSAMNSRLVLVAGSAPMLFNEAPGFAKLINAHYSFDTQYLYVKPVIVGNQKLGAILKSIPLDSSPTGIGFILNYTWQTPVPLMNTASTFDPETGQVILPYVMLTQWGPTPGDTIQSVVQAEMELVPDSDPMVFSLISYTPIGP